jgi:ATP-binding cassette, subfamily C, bacterial LapB
MSRIVLRDTASEQIYGTWVNALNEHLDTSGGHLNTFATCLLRLLEALKWTGSARQIIEALPYGVPNPTAIDMRDALARLGFETIKIHAPAHQINHRLLPCLHIDKSDSPSILLNHTVDGYMVINRHNLDEPKAMKVLPNGTTYIVRPFSKKQNQATQNVSGWLRHTLKPFRGLIGMSLVVSFFINMVALVTPITIMTIYDQVIGKESPRMLLYLMLGVGIALFFEFGMRFFRSWAQAYIGARLDYIVGSKVFEQIMHLSAMFTERAPVGGQVTRMREFETFREIFTGPLATLILDLPFIFIFITAIAMIAGPLAYIPVVLTVVYILLAFLVTPELKSRSKVASEARSSRHAFLVEMMWDMYSIKQLGLEDMWRKRCRMLSADASQANYEVAAQNAIAQNTAQTLMTIAGVATLGFGVIRTMDGNMTLGALIATMILVWRVLSPVQTLFGLVQRIEQLQQSLKQLVNIINYEREQESGDSPETPIRFDGRLSFQRVSMRYTQDANAVLLGLSFTVEPGEILGIVGDSGSGKTTLAKLALGIYRPQAGSITIDGIDIRQLRPITLRQTFSYVPQQNHAFSGSLLDNIRLADPAATFEQVCQACHKAGLLHKIEALPNGLHTTFKEGLQSQAPPGFLRQLALARAFLRNAPLVIMDEPAMSLEDKDEEAFLDALQSLRGQSTVIMITQRPSHMRLCDKLLVLQDGQMQHFGPTEQVLAEQSAIQNSKSSPSWQGANNG